MRKFRILALVLALLVILPAVVACKKTDDNGDGTGDNTKEVVYQPVDPADAVEHKDYTSVYDMIGAKVTIDMVTENDDGTAKVTYEGKDYELGMDFLSMAMVYNTTVPAGSTKYKTAEDVYNEWWKLYIQRWNLLVPEVPLYSNQYFDIYNAKIENFKTTPYWGPADAIIASKVKAGETNSVILGSTTDLSGAFRNAGWGKSSPGSSDLDIQNLTSGHETVMAGTDGSYVWNMKALASVPTSKVNDDGSLTYTIKVKNDLKFSDGSAITAKNYIAYLLANSTAVSVAAGGNGTVGNTVVGYTAFNIYDGTNDGKDVVIKEAKDGKEAVTAKASKYFSGVQLIDDYTFAVTFTSDYAGYYYAMINASFSPSALALYLGSAGDIVVDPTTKQCGLNDAFYAKTTVEGKETYKTAAEIVANLEWNSKIPYSGPYYVANYDASSHTATLKLNKQYPGDDVRGTASIETITYVKIVSETQLDMLKKGEVDVLAGITGGDDTKAALEAVKSSNGKFAETHYDRAGYGKLGFRCDFGPTSFASVRRAIIYTINRPAFAQTFTGGYGSVVDGPYYEGFSAFKAVKDSIVLNKYTYSADSAVDELVEGGWVYNVRGEAFDASKDDIRYKKLEGYELSKDNLNFKSNDGKYSTVKIDGAYYMPLAINWYGTQPNSVTDQLITAWQTNPDSTTKIGMYITYTSTEFAPGLYGELSRMENYGYDGTPKLNAINFASGFTSAAYDYAFNWTINPDMYDDYSAAYVKDEADFWENYSK